MKIFVRCLAVPFAIAALVACGEAPELDAELDEPEVEVEPEPECTYPASAGLSAVGSIMPNMAWDPAYLDANTTTKLDLETVYCENPEVSSIVFVLVAEWCPNCPSYVQYVNGQAAAMAANGAQLVFVNLQDRQYQPASSLRGQDYIAGYIGDGAGVRVGTSDGVPMGTIYNSPIWSGVPNAFVVRTADMKVVATQETTNLMLDFGSITQNIDATDPTLPQFNSRCTSTDDESHEPNDVPGQAGNLAPDTSIAGGICNEAPDFYRVDIAGDWQLDLNFTHAVGDLDVYVINEATMEPVTGSDSTDDNESFTHSGPALVQVLGYRGASAPYTLTVTGL